jgi:hypothetical protein
MKETNARGLNVDGWFEVDGWPLSGEVCHINRLNRSRVDFLAVI